MRVLFAQVVALLVSISTAASMQHVPWRTYSLLLPRGFLACDGRTGWGRSNA
ncbi:MAG: hypothetical protein IT423_17345 [Pirellulaceae bacterium]|nr:hypothetical protein [Pirellulaceae bacterium]